MSNRFLNYEYTTESWLPNDEYSGKSRIHGGKYTGEFFSRFFPSWLPVDEYTSTVLRWIHWRRNFWSINRELKPVYFPVSSRFSWLLLTAETVFLVIGLVFFQVSPVCLVFFLFWRGDSGLVLEKWLPFLGLRFGRGNHLQWTENSYHFQSGPEIPPRNQLRIRIVP